MTCMRSWRDARAQKLDLNLSFKYQYLRRNLSAVLLRILLYWYNEHSTKKSNWTLADLWFVVGVPVGVESVGTSDGGGCGGRVSAEAIDSTNVNSFNQMCDQREG